MSRTKDETGSRFGMLKVVGRASSDARGQALWRCRCDCGGSSVVRGAALRNGNTTSCGCQKNTWGRVSKTHGLSGAPEFGVWCNIIQRCTNPRANSFKYYGGRGISVCERWRQFESFWSDMGPRPSPGHSIDRIDVDGNYEPSNCRWATRKTQANNNRANRVIEYDNKRLTIAQWAERTGLHPTTIWSRLDHGWSAKDALTTARYGRLPLEPRSEHGRWSAR